jgi:serine protease Do
MSAPEAILAALLRTTTRLLLVALLLALLITALAVRLSVGIGRRLVALHAAPSFATAAWYVAVAPIVLLWHAGAFAADAGSSLSRTFKQVDSAVVVVRTAGHAAGPWAGQTVTTSGIGSGVLISADGDVLTAAHVVQTADAIGVEFPDGEIIRARIVASDPAADVALLRLERVPAGIAPVKLGNSDGVEVGDQVFVVGAPLGISHTLTVGHISARRAPNGASNALASAELFQTDAAINQGNSGGPLFNLDGDVIGIVSHIVSRSGGSEGLGFVVTSNAARRLVIDEPSVWVGLEGFLLTNDIARAFNVPSGAAGLLVQRIAEGSPAQRVGLRAGALPVAVGEQRLLIGGDIILAVEGIALGTTDAYENIRRRLIELRAGGNPIRVTVLRGGETIELAGLI